MSKMRKRKCDYSSRQRRKGKEEERRCLLAVDRLVVGAYFMGSFLDPEADFRYIRETYKSCIKNRNIRRLSKLRE